MLKNIESQKDYDEYKARVESFFEREGINNLTIASNFENCEPYFSWENCECCNRHLGGDRYDCSGYNPETDEIYEYSVCVDCLYYNEYGQLDDMTMLDYDLN